MSVTIQEYFDIQDTTTLHYMIEYTVGIRYLCGAERKGFLLECLLYAFLLSDSVEHGAPREL